MEQGFHLDPSIYLLNKESGGFGSGAVQMKALPSAANTVSVAGIEKDGKTDSDNPLEHHFSLILRVFLHFLDVTVAYLRCSGVLIFLLYGEHKACSY